MTGEEATRPSKPAGAARPLVLQVIDGKLQETIPRPGRPRKYPLKTKARKQVPTDAAQYALFDDLYHLKGDFTSRPLPESALAPAYSPSASWSDPFVSTALPTNPDAAALLRLYIAEPIRWDGPQAREVNAMSTKLCEIRRHSWFPRCRDSSAAVASLVAYVAATGGFLKPGDTRQKSATRLLTVALVETNKMLSIANNISSEQLVLAVNFLMLAAQRLGDTTAFDAHSRGLGLLLKHRCQLSQPSSRRLERLVQHEDLEDTLNVPLRPKPLPEEREALGPRLPARLESQWQLDAKSEQFERLVEMGLLSRPTAQTCSMTLAWAYLSGQTKETFDQMMVFFPGQHLWVGMFRSEARPLPFDQLTFSGVRLICHMMAYPWKTPDRWVCPITRSSTVETLINSFAVLDMGLLVDRCPDLVLWICILAAYWVQDEPETREKFHIVFKQVRGPDNSLGAFIRKRKELDEKFLWPSMLTQDAWRFWSGSSVPCADVPSASKEVCFCASIFSKAHAKVLDCDT